MNSQLNSNNKVLLFVILGAIIFFIFIMPMLDKINELEETKLKEKLTNSDSIVKIDKNMCSKQCCKFTQWPVPYQSTDKTMSDDELKKYIERLIEK